MASKSKVRRYVYNIEWKSWQNMRPEWVFKGKTQKYYKETSEAEGDIYYVFNKINKRWIEMKKEYFDEYLKLINEGQKIVPYQSVDMRKSKKANFSSVRDFRTWKKKSNKLTRWQSHYKHMGIGEAKNCTMETPSTTPPELHGMKDDEYNYIYFKDDDARDFRVNHG